MRAAVPQGLVVLLTADIHEPCAEFAQRLYGNRPAVDPGLRPAVRADHPPQQAGRVVSQLVLLQPAAGGAAGGRFEGGQHLEAAGAGADGLRVTALPEGQGEGIDQDGFAGAGFARQHGEAPGEVDA